MIQTIRTVVKRCLIGEKALMLITGQRHYATRHNFERRFRSRITRAWGGAAIGRLRQIVVLVTDVIAAAMTCRSSGPGLPRPALGARGRAGSIS